MLAPNKPALLAIFVISQIFFVNSVFSGDVRRDSFNRTPVIRQFFALGGNYQSDQNSKRSDLNLAYRYKSNIFINDFEFMNRATYAEDTMKVNGQSVKIMVKNQELYDAELSSKRMIGQTNNYLNFYNRSKYDEYSNFYYDITNVAGMGRRFADDRLEADINIGYKQVKNFNSEMVINPTLRVRFDLTKDISLICKGYLFRGETSHNEELKSRISYRIKKNVYLEMLHTYEKTRYLDEKTRSTINNVNRILVVRIRYDF